MEQSGSPDCEAALHYYFQIDAPALQHPDATADVRMQGLDCTLDNYGNASKAVRLARCHVRFKDAIIINLARIQHRGRNPFGMIGSRCA
jgi:hypothetical protein